MPDLTQWPAKWRGKRIVVLGDLCLDEYIVGKAQRLSREAPVPVLEFQERFSMPGAACSPALNIQAVGGNAALVGLVGDDEAGHTLLLTLNQAGIDTTGVIVDAAHSTTVKTRVLASHLFPHQMVRIDKVDRQPIGRATTNKLRDAVARAAAEADAVLVSDYRSGVVSAPLVARAVEAARQRNIVTTVDSQGEFAKYRGATLLRCNKEEAESYLRRSLTTDKAFTAAAAALQRRLNVASVIITRGSDGLSLTDAAGQSYHLPASNPSEVYDVTGAGDAVIALVTCGLTGGSDLFSAAQVGNIAAGLVVRKLGNATVALSELTAALTAYDRDPTQTGTGKPAPVSS